MPIRVMAAPLPLTLVHPAFCAFADALEQVPPPRIVTVANDLGGMVDGFFATTDGLNRHAYKDTLNTKLRALFPTLYSICIGNTLTDGAMLALPSNLPIINLAVTLTGDPTAKNNATFLGCVREALRPGDPWRRCKSDGEVLYIREELLAALPSVSCFQLNIHHGSVLEVRGATLLAQGMLSEALAAAPLRGIRGGAGVTALARILHACVAGVAALKAAYDAIPLERGKCFVPLPATAPLASLINPLAFDGGRRFKCIRSLHSDTTRLAFEAVELPPAADGAAGAAGGVPVPVGGTAAPRVAIKLARGRYGTDVHRLASSAGYAPALHAVKGLHSDMWAAVMDLLDIGGEGGWQPYNASTAPAATKDAVVAAYLAAFTHDGVDYVHGNLRDGNVLVRDDTTAAGGLRVAFIGFDRAGRAGEVTYPPTMNLNFRAAGGAGMVGPGHSITRTHDLLWLGGKLSVWYR